MTLLSPIHLLGALGVAVPVLIHLFGRRRPRHVRFPSLMLLEEAQQRRRSPLRLKRLLALLMRAGAIMLLALALAGPIARWRPLAWVAPGGALHAVLLDVSASMGAGDAFADARRAAGEVIAALPPGTRLLVGAADADPAVWRDADPLSREQALSLTDGLRLSDQRTRMDDVIAAVRGRMEDLGEAGTIFIVTDLQATGYDGTSVAGDSAPGEVVIVDAGVEIAGNLAVTDADVVDPVALSDRPARVRAAVGAWGEAGGERLPLALQVGEDVASFGVTPTPGRSSWAELVVTPRAAGLQKATVSLPPDDFPADDWRLLAVPLRKSLRVAIIGDENRTRFLRAALDPYGDERTMVQVRMHDAAELEADDLSRADALVLADPPLLPASAVAAIAAEAERGMGVLLFAGPETQAEHYAERLAPALGLEGVRLGEVVRREDGVALTLDELHPGPLRAFVDPAAGDLGTARFTAIRRVILAPESGALVWARYSDGTAAAVGTSLGRGRVALLNMAPDDDWSDLALQPAFVPLMHRLVYHLAAGRAGRVLEGSVGERTVGLLAAADGDVTVAPPDGGPPQPIQTDDGAWSFVPPERDLYRLEVAGEEVGGFAANLAPEESDLTRLSAAQVAERLRPLRVAVAPQTEAAQAARAHAAPMARLAGLAALLALLLLAVEAVYSLEHPEPAED